MRRREAAAWRCGRWCEAPSRVCLPHSYLVEDALARAGRRGDARDDGVELDRTHVAVTLVVKGASPYTTRHH